MRKKLGEVLLEAGLIDELQLEAALSHQRSFGGHLGRILTESGFVTEPQLVEALSHLLGVPRIELQRREAPAELLQEVSLDFAEKFSVVPVALRSEAKGDVLYLAMSDPTNLEAIDTLQFKTGKRISPLLASETEIEGAIRRFYYGERPREVTSTALQNVQFPGQEVSARAAGIDDDIPVVTGATLVEPAAPAPLPASDPDWFLQMDGPAPAAAVPVSAPPPSPFAAAPAGPATLTSSPSSPFAAAPGALSPSASSVGFAPPPASAASRAPDETPASREELFGTPNSYLGRDDDVGLGQSDPRRPAVSAPESSGALPVARARADDELDPTAVQPLELDVVQAISLDDDDDTPIQLASAADFLHGGPPLDDAGAERGLALDDEDDVPLELASAAELISTPPSEAQGAEPAAGALALDVEPPSARDDDEDGPMLLATAAELAQMSLETDALEPAEAPEPPAMPGFEDLSELTDVALARLDEIDVPAAEVDVPFAEVDVPFAEVDMSFAEPSEVDAAPTPLAPADDAQSLRPLPAPGGVLPDAPDEPDEGPIAVVNMPPDRRPVGFVAVPAAPKPEPSALDDFGNPLDVGSAFDGEMEALDIEGSVFDADSGEIEPAPGASEPPLSSEPLSPADFPASSSSLPSLELSDDVEITEDIEIDDVAPPAPLLTAHAIAELEHGHDGTTTVTGAGLVDTPERVGGDALPGEVMTLALPTPAYSNASVVDAPWRLADEAPPRGRGQSDVPLAPFGLTSSAFATVDDVDTLAPAALLAEAALQQVSAAESAAVPLPGRAPPYAADDDAPGFSVPDTLPVSALTGSDENGDEGQGASDDGQELGFADAWREAAERQLLQRSVPDSFEVPEHRRPFTPAATPSEESPEAEHPYEASGPATPDSDGAPPWTVLLADASAPLEDAAPDDAGPSAEASAEPPASEPAQEALAPDDDAAPAAWSPRADAEERSTFGAPLPSSTPRSVLIADVVHMDDDLTPESSPPAPAAGRTPSEVAFTPTPTMITRMGPEELRALAERLVQRGALTSDDIDAARKAKAAAGGDDDSGA